MNNRLSRLTCICFSFVCLVCYGCAIDLHRDFEDTNNQIVSHHLNFDHLLTMDSEIKAHVLRSAFEPKLHIKVVNKTRTLIDYQIVWRKTCEYILTIDRRTRDVVGWRYATRDKTWCFSNP
jgi:thiamine phosphate synthase YjbQ (UPF0047 family)